MYFRSHRRFGTALLCAGLLFSGTDRGGAVEEYQLKAAMVYNLARFVEWPPEALKSPVDPITICVAGDSPIEGPLQQAVSGKVLEEHRMAFKHLTDPRQAAGCQILFFSASTARGKWRPMLADLNTTGVLTVGEAERFASEGGMVNLKTDGARIQIQVNLAAAEQGRLRISSKLLNLAEIVKR
ncbi:MAG TPA: YfiR family protein [Candidatus Limnocylindrales bacterium]|nr:YfiR family protein [Candidatus Limnocylindrales bacterium]